MRAPGRPRPIVRRAERWLAPSRRSSMAALLALLSATAYGVGDFFGGLSARRLPSAAVVLRTHAAGLLGLLAVVPLVGGAAAQGDLVIGAAGGLAGGLGVLAFYRAMATG